MAGHDLPATDRQKRFILLVDSNTRDLFVTGMLLQRLSYDVYISSSAEDALKIISAAVPALVILDVMLSGQNSVDLLSRIKQDPRTQAVPVIIQASRVDPKMEELCLAIGCSTYLAKPVEPNTMYRAIQMAIETVPRHYIRLKTFLRVSFEGPDAGEGPLGPECITAISENGLYVQTLKPRPVKSVHDLTIQLYGRRVPVRAMVLYAYTMSGGPFKEPGMGMKFIEISELDRTLIRRFIEDQITQDIHAADAAPDGASG